MVQRRAARFVKAGMECMKVYHRSTIVVSTIKMTCKQSPNSLLLNYQQFGYGITFRFKKKTMGVPGKIQNQNTSVTTLIQMDKHFFRIVIVRGVALLKRMQRPTFWIYLNYKFRPIHANPSANIFIEESS